MIAADQAAADALAVFLDDYQIEAARLAEPHKRAAELQRRVDIAAAFVADLHCTCSTPDDECPKHYLERVLAGDE